jgi:hypothetical protein
MRPAEARLRLTRRSVLGALAAPLWSADAQPLTLPARLNDFHQIQVPVRLNGSEPLWLELDSGGGGPLLFIDLAKAAALGIQPTSMGSSASPTEGVPEPDGRARVTADLSGLRLENLELVIKQRALGKDGILALAVLARYVVEFDYETPAIRLHDAAAFQYRGRGAAMAFTVAGTNPYLPGTLVLPGGETVAGRFVIDTGAAGSILYLSHAFVQRARLLDRGLKWVPDSVGLNAARFQRFSAGPVRVEEPVVRRFPARGFGGTSEPDGMIGVEFLRRFRIFFDFRRNQAIFEANRHVQDPSLFDASGIRVERTARPDLHRIFQVIPGTPAAAAGIRESDLLVAVDGVPVIRLSPVMILEELSHGGRSCTLLIERGHEVRSVTLELRKIL